MRATVVGGGIGGLATALALQRTGWQVTVLERSPALDRGGAGLVLWPNAQRCLPVLGIDEAVRSGAATLTGSAVRRADGSLLSRIRPDHSPLGIVRADLVAALATALAPGTLRLDSRVTDVRDVEADLVVGADGLHSVVRASLGSRVRPGFRGYTVWRAMVPASGGTAELCETWGAGRRFGMVPVGRGLTYLYAAAPAVEGERRSDELAELKRQFGDWHAPIPAVLDTIDPRSLLRHDIADLPPGRTSLHRGRTVLVGDAGHAMEPNLGQGAGLAIEDAVVLAHALATEPSVPAALGAYTRGRARRVTALARQSRQIGRVARLTRPSLVAARDLAVRATPDRLAARAMAAATGWCPPQTTSPRPQEIR